MTAVDSAIPGAGGAASSSSTTDVQGPNVHVLGSGPPIVASEAAGSSALAEGAGSSSSDAAKQPEDAGATRALALLTLQAGSEKPSTELPKGGLLGGLLPKEVPAACLDIGAQSKDGEPTRTPSLSRLEVPDDQAAAPKDKENSAPDWTVAIKRERLDKYGYPVSVPTRNVGPSELIDMTGEVDTNAAQKAPQRETHGAGEEKAEVNPPSEGSLDVDANVSMSEEGSVSDEARNAFRARLRRDIEANNRQSLETSGANSTTAQVSPKSKSKPKSKAKSKRSAAPAPHAIEKRPRRTAAVVADIALHDQAMREEVNDATERQVQKRDRGDIELDVDDDDLEFVDMPMSEVANVQYLVARRMGDDGEREYLALWEEVKPGEQKADWIKKKDMIQGLAFWVKFVDKMYQRLGAVDGDLPDFFKYLDSNFAGMKVAYGANKDFTCVYTAMKSLSVLTGPGFEITEELIKEFETKRRLERVKAGGLTFALINEFVGLCQKHGWGYQIGANQYQGHKTGLAAILSVVKPGTNYLVGTADRLKRGHCIVVEVTSDPDPDFVEVFLHEDGTKIGLGEFTGAKDIIFIREVKPRPRGGDQEMMSSEDLEKAEAETMRPTTGATARKKTRRSRKKPRIEEVE